MIKFIGNEISIPLAHIFNLSLSTGTFPSELKLCRVIPIFKSGSALECCPASPEKRRPSAASFRPRTHSDGPVSPTCLLTTLKGRNPRWLDSTHCYKTGGEITLPRTDGDGPNCPWHGKRFLLVGKINTSSSQCFYDNDEKFLPRALPPHWFSVEFTFPTLGFPTTFESRMENFVV